MVALKENESLAVSVGIDVTRYLVLAAVVSAGIAGAAGSLYAHYLKIIDPDVFLFLYTVTMVIMVITGGKGTLAGPIVGGLIFGFIPVVARSFASPELQWILYGLFMILIVFVLPQGIVPAIEKWFGVANETRGPGAGGAQDAGYAVMDAASTQARPALSIEHIAVHFGGLVAIVGFELCRQRGRGRQPDRPQRRRQDHRLQRHHRLFRPSEGEVRYPRSVASTI